MKKILTVIFAAFLTACGGGGGGSSTTGATEVVIDEKNSTEISELIISTTVFPSDLDWLTYYILPDSPMALSLSADDSDSQAIDNISSRIIENSGESGFLDKYSVLDTMVRSYTETYYCDNGGSIMLTCDLGDDDYPNEEGEYCEGQYNNCIFYDWYTGYPEKVDGNLKWEILQWSSYYNNAFEVVSDVYVDFVGSPAVRIQGDMTYTWTEYDPDRWNVSVYSSSIDYTVGSERVDISDLAMSLDFEYVENSFTTSGALDISAQISSTSIGGYFNLRTDSPLIYDGIYNLYDLDYYYPVEGRVTASGANDTYMTLDADTGDVDTVLQTVNGKESELFWYVLDPYY